jgi:lipoprotein-anchoring transpeptidase ErfK/SrfK
MYNFKFATLVTLATTVTFAAPNPRRLVISLADHKLAVVEDGHTLKVYSVAVGKPSTPSPTGTFEIIALVAQPTWYGPHQVVPPGSNNPLGTRWIGLSCKGYGIHGTNAPGSIGKSTSHGCIRLRRQDIEELFELVQVGDEVELVSEATGDLAKVFEVQQPPEKVVVPSTTHVQSVLTTHALSVGVP